MHKKGSVSRDNSKQNPAAGATSSGSGKPSTLESPSDAKKTGRVQFDDRGNAVWEWSVATGAFGREVSTERLQKLENPALSLAEDAPTPFDHVKSNPLGTVKGYNPYDSGKLGKAAAPPRKKDLKKFSEWVRLKKQANTGNQDDE
jgi:hypothetical protein